MTGSEVVHWATHFPVSWPFFPHVFVIFLLLKQFWLETFLLFICSLFTVSVVFKRLRIRAPLWSWYQPQSNDFGLQVRKKRVILKPKQPPKSWNWSILLLLLFQGCAASQSPRDPGVCESPLVPIKDGHSTSQVLWWGLFVNVMQHKWPVRYVWHRFGFIVWSSQNGFDYLLTYSDDPQTVFPRYCVSWMVSSGKLL